MAEEKGKQKALDLAVQYARERVQFGKPISPAKRKELEPVKGEFSETLKHEAGTLSMARRQSDPDSATSRRWRDCSDFRLSSSKPTFPTRAATSL